MPSCCSSEHITDKERLPKISCLICTFNRADFLWHVMEGLTAQTLPRSEFEVVVVDDGSTDATYQCIDAFRQRLPMRYFWQENAGLAAAKNRAVAEATAPIVLFMDDDDAPAPSLLEQHLRTHASFPQIQIAALGHTNLHPDLVAKPLMQFVTEVGCQLFSYGRTHDGSILDYTWFWGGRSSCKRALLDMVGPFNPIFRFGCEDIELGYRLSKHGLRVVYNRAAVSTMLRGMSVDEFCVRTERQGRSNYAFSLLHAVPEIAMWTEIKNAAERWSSISPRFDDILRSARALDAIANARVEHRIELDCTFTEMLHQAYFAAFDASRLKGIVSAMQCA